MANVSTIKHNGDSYDIKDATARSAIVTLHNDINNIEPSPVIPFGQVDSTSTATAFTATVPNITELKDGMCCYVRNGVVGSSGNWTLNINGLGAKPVYMSNVAATRSTTQFTAYKTVLFIYNSTRVAGGCWDFYYPDEIDMVDLT